MERKQVAEWLQRYTEAWKSYDRTAIASLFSPDVRYRYHPFDDPITGRAAIVSSWLDDQDDRGTYDGSYAPVAVDGDTAVARGSSTYLDEEGRIRTVYDNIFVMRFAEDGTCREFTEWFMERPSAQETNADPIEPSARDGQTTG
jgi:SnoaL-like domain